MICAHCNETFTPWQGLSFNLTGYKCPACGKLSYAKYPERRDPVSTYAVLGFVAAFVVLLFVAAESGSDRFIRYVPSIAMIGLIIMMFVMSLRWRHRYYTVASLPPQELRKRCWFFGGGVAYLFAMSLHLSARWFGMDEDITFGVAMAVAIAFIVITFATRSSKANPELP